MGLVLDSGVLIAAERAARPISLLLTTLAEEFGETEIVLSSISVVELEHGLHRASTKAFVNWANIAEAEPSVPSVRETDPVARPKVRPTAEDRHEIPLRLKWRVHVRDGFRCVACGKNPPQHGVMLHADHIKPWADGGKTILENLQTLCEPCNLGKGRSYGK